MQRRGRPRHDDILTPREWEVLGLLREGLTNEQIAQRLSVTHDTAKFHVSEILGKLGVGSRAEAAAWQPQAPPRRRTFVPALVLPFGLQLEGAGRAFAVAVIGLTAGALGLLTFGVLLSNGSADRSLGKIAFERDGDIWVRDLPDGTPRRLTHAGDALNPRWSPSGDWLLYRTDDGPQRIVSADGASDRLLLDDGRPARWLPDEDRVYHFGMDAPAVSDIAGSDTQPLLWPYPGEPDGELMGFLPDGRGQWLALGYPRGQEPGRGRDGRPDGAMGVYDSLWRIDLDGGNAERLTGLNPLPGDPAFPARLSPDGTELLLLQPEASDRWPLRVLFWAAAIPDGEPRRLPLVGSFGFTNTQSDTAMIEVDGSHSAFWTDKRIGILDLHDDSFTPFTPEDIAAIAPAFSPDGRQIAYAAGPDFGPDGGNEALAQRRIWLMDADGANQRALTSGDGVRDESPQWSADGEHILFARLGMENICDVSYLDVMLYSLEADALRLIERLPLSPMPAQSLFSNELEACNLDPDSPVAFLVSQFDLGSAVAWWQPAP